MQIMSAVLHEAHSQRAENRASPQLQQAANEFEANFLQELLKPLSDDSLFGAGGDGDSGGSMGTVSSIAAQALADGIAKRGGLGIAKRVLAELVPIETAESNRNGLAGGLKCSGCAQHSPLALQNASDAVNVEMLGQGNLIDNHGLPGMESSTYNVSGDDKGSARLASAVEQFFRH